MGLELILEDGRQLDIMREPGMGLNYGLENITNPETKTSNYSKTIILAGTKNNHKILGQLWDITADFTIFNPNFKLLCKLYSDNNLLMDGYLQLRNINTEENNVNYEVVINSTVIDLWQEMGENKLTTLDFSEFNHILNFSNITSTYNNTYEDGYCYFLPFKGDNTYESNDFKPAIFLRNYLDKIANKYGFSLGGSLFDDELFNKEILTYSGENPLMNEDEARSREFMGYATAINLMSQYNYSSYGTFTRYITPKPYNQENDPNNIFDLANNIWTVNKVGRYNLNVTMGAEVIMNSFGLDAYLDVDGPNGNGGAARQLNDIEDIDFYIQAQKQTTVGGVWVNFGDIVPATPLGDLLGLPGNKNLFGLIVAPFNSGNGYTRKIRYNFNGVLFNGENLDVNTRVRLQLFYRPNERWRYASSNLSQTRTINFKWEFKPKLYNPTSGSFNSPINSNLWNSTNRDYVVEGTEILLNDYIPRELTQKDLFKDLITRYNLIVRPSTENPRHILLDTRDEFYLQGNDLGTLDLTENDDLDYTNKIEFLSDLSNKKLTFKYKDGGDEFSEEYFKTTKVRYGQQSVVYDNEFVKGEKIIESLFDSVPLVWNNLVFRSVVVPSINSSKPEGTPKVLIFGGGKNTFNNQPWYYKTLTGLNTLFTYPYAGHWNDPREGTLDNHFNTIITLNNGVEDAFEFYDGLTVFNNNNLFNRYWRSYTTEINKSKVVTKKLYLTDLIVSDLKDNLNRKLIIGGVYYRILEIQDYDPTVKNNSTIMKLLKTEIDYFPFEPTSTTTSIPELTDVVIIRGGIPRVTRKVSGDALLTQSREVTQTETQHALIVGEDNYIGDTKDTMIVGDNNIIFAGVERSGILGGDGNTISPMVKGSWIIAGDNKMVTENNVIILGNTKIKDGYIEVDPDVITGDMISEFNLFPNYNDEEWELIDGGDNTLRYSGFTNTINLITGGEDLDNN